MMGLLSRAGEAWRTLVRTGSAHPRDPVLAEWFGGYATTASGINVTPDNARECPEVDACISLNEDTIATVPLDLYERKGEDQRDRAAGHPLHELLHDKPNGWQTSAEFRGMMEGFRETHGNAYARIIGTRRGFPDALEPVHPNEMRPFRASNGAVAYRWSPPDSVSRVLLQHEVLHLRDKPAKRSNLVEGQSRVERHREAVGRALAAGRYLSLFFKNNATSKIAIDVPGNLTNLQVEDLIKQFLNRHGGDNLHRPVVNHSGMTTKPLGVSNADAQMVEVYDQATAQIARVWGVPLHLIGEMSKSTSWGTGIEQQSIGFVVYYMRSKFVVWEQALNAALMSSETRKKFYYEFNIDALLRGDFKTRMEGYALMIQWGLATPNEIRRLMNFAPIDGGDDRLQPLNMVPATKIMEVLMKAPATSQERSERFDEATKLLASINSALAGRKLNGAHHPEHDQ